MRVLVTGAAGFIGSHLTRALGALGDDVIGVDRACGVDLLDAELEPLLDGVEVVYHLAARPGVRGSWSTGFDEHVRDNVLATQRLLEASAAAPSPPRVVYASSSSVYGQTAAYPSSEVDPPRPHSPYGVTKLAGEHLCLAYASNHGLVATALRYFTVYGPRQRPDMAIHRLCEAALAGTSFPLYGDGSAVRDFTYVDDVVAATVAAGTNGVGGVLNVAGGADTSMAELVALVGELAGRQVAVERCPPQRGDVDRTGGRIDAIHAALGWTPTVGLREGVAAQLAWHRERRR